MLSYDRGAIVYGTFCGIFTVLTVVATTYFYVCKRKSNKPKFISAIFVMLNLMWPFILVSIFIPYDFGYGSAKYWTVIAMVSLINECIPLAHWTFAIYYFKVALSTSLFLKWESL